MKELGVPFEEELVPFGGNERHRTFGEFSPSGRVPCLVHESDGSAGSMVVWDSLAITEYVHPRQRAA
jgi:glutathione S-transferase